MSWVEPGSTGEVQTGNPLGSVRTRGWCRRGGGVCREQGAGTRSSNAHCSCPRSCPCTTPSPGPTTTANTAQGKKHNAALISLPRRRVDVLHAMLRNGTLYQQTRPHSGPRLDKPHRDTPRTDRGSTYTATDTTKRCTQLGNSPVHGSGRVLFRQCRSRVVLLQSGMGGVVPQHSHYTRPSTCHRPGPVPRLPATTADATPASATPPPITYETRNHAA